MATITDGSKTDHIVQTINIIIGTYITGITCIGLTTTISGVHFMLYLIVLRNTVKVQRMQLDYRSKKNHITIAKEVFFRLFSQHDAHYILLA